MRSSSGNELSRQICRIVPARAGKPGNAADEYRDCAAAHAQFGPTSTLDEVAAVTISGFGHLPFGMHGTDRKPASLDRDLRI